MTDWSQLFLGVIAAATLLMAIVQVGIIVVAARVARQAQEAAAKAQQTMAAAQQAIASVREEVQPLIAKAHAIADEAAKSATLAAAQMAKIDQLVTDLAKRANDTSAIVQEAVVAPAREGLAIVAALKAALAALRTGGDARGRTSRSEEEDPLFIG